MANRRSDNVIQNSPVGPLNNPIVTQQYRNLTLRAPSVLWLVPDLPLQGKEIQSLHMCREPGKNRCSNLWIYNKKQNGKMLFMHTQKNAEKRNHKNKKKSNRLRAPFRYSMASRFLFKHRQHIAWSNLPKHQSSR